MKCIILKENAKDSDGNKFILYCAICLDQYTATSGRTIKEARENMELVMAVQRRLPGKLSHAPKEYWEYSKLSNCYVFYITGKLLRKKYKADWSSWK